MQIGISNIPSHGYGSLLTKQPSFCRRGSSLNPNLIAHSSSSSSSSVSSTSAAAAAQKLSSRLAEASSLKTHISNLDKLFPKQISDPYHPRVNNNNSTNNSNRRNYKGLFEALNLTKIWPEVKAAAEEMSPRNLNRLQRLLLTTPAEYSPRNNLGSRWLEYHGCNDWAGLLDPLDENLRREIVRYGEFIQAAYHAFHSDPATSAHEAPTPRHVSLPDRSYKVTKSLYATSSVGLPKWVDDVAPDWGWMTQRSSWIGYVAVCDDEKEIQRMGRRDIVIAFRGTSTCLEWAENVRDVLVRVDHDADQEQGTSQLNQNTGQLQAKVECGFWNLYKTSGGPHIPSLSESLTQEIRRLVKLYEGESLSITITGHSLGAALSILAADELSKCVSDSPPIAVFSFGGPRVGNRGFASRIQDNGVKVLRVVNSQDMITRVPGMFVNEDLDHKLREEAKTKPVLDMLDNNMPWAYSHVGSELRVDSKMSPFLKPDADVGCCHDLEAYLHLVDGFSASDCPFRANAKRSLVKLLHEQGSNVKKLYTNKAKSLMSLSLSNLDHSKSSGILMPSCLPSPS